MQRRYRVIRWFRRRRLYAVPQSSLPVAAPVFEFGDPYHDWVFGDPNG